MPEGLGIFGRFSFPFAQAYGAGDAVFYHIICRETAYQPPGTPVASSAGARRFPRFRLAAGARTSGSPGLLSGGHHVDGMAKGRLHRLGDPFHKGGMGPQAGQQLFRRQAVHHPAGEFPDHIRGPWAHELGA